MVEYRVINTSDEAQAFFISLCQSLREQRIKEGFKWITVCIEGDVAKDGINLVTLRASGFPVLVFNVSRCPGVMHNVSEFLHNPTVLKVMYDCRMDAVALFRRFGIRLQEVFDLQIALSRNTDNVSVGSAFSKFPINLSNAHKSEEDISKQMLNAAMNVENLFNVFKSMCVCSNLELARNLIVPLTDDSINRELEGVAEGTLPTIDSSNYAKLDVRKQIHLTALAFYNDILLHDVDCREQCQDRTVCKLMYADWKRRTHVPGNPIHTRYKGGFSQVFTKLVFMGKTVQRAAEELEHNVIAWSIDSAGSGSTCARSARQVANTTVRQRRAQCERDRNGIEVGPYVIPDAVSTGQLVSSTITIKNISEKPQALLAVGFLQSTATGSNGVFQSKLSCLQLPLQLPPGAKAEVEIVCNPACGMNRDILELNFHTFSIARFLEIQAGSAELLDALKPTAPYQRRRRQRKQRDTATLTVGNPPRGGGRRWQRDCAEHKLPHAFRAKERLKTMTVELDAVHQNLVVDPMGSPAALQGEYAQFYHKLLFVEELQLHSDLHEFDMEDVVLRKSGALFTLAVPGLAENRPSVLRGDKLIVRLAGTNDSHHGFAHRIERDQVYVRFHDKFPYIAGIPVDVEFTLNRTLLRIQHNQLDLVHHLGTAVLYPGRDNISLKAPRAIPDDLKEFRRGLNPEQWAAVRNILAGSARPSPYIVFGPPGTGKTRTMVEAITQMVHIFSREVRILACAPSNTAADVLCGGLGKNITPSQMVRVVAESRTKKNILEAVHKFCPPVDDESHFSLPADKEALGAKQVVVTTLSMASKLPFLYDLDPGFFDVIVIDEAGQAMEPEATAVIASLLNPTNGQVVLAGDPRQLGPIIHSSIAKTRGLEVSLLERLTQRQVYQKGGDGKYNPHLLTKLVRNYRSHASILTVPSALFYDSELFPEADKVLCNSLADWEHLPQRGFPLVFHGIAGKDDREANSPSWFNVHEVEMVRDYVLQLLETRKNPIQPEEIGIIAPYQKQVQKIRTMLTKFVHVPGKDVSRIMVGSAEKFQGQEKRVTIISTTRACKDFLDFDAKHALGFLASPKRFNVAVTRAMSLLIVIGHPAVLACCPNWHALLTHCQKNNACRGVPVPLNVEHTEENRGTEAGCDELTSALQRLSLMETGSGDDGTDCTPSEHIQQTAVGFVREE